MPTLPSITVIISSMRCAAYANFCALLLALHATLFFHGTGKPFIRGRRTGFPLCPSIQIALLVSRYISSPLHLCFPFFFQVGFVQRNVVGCKFSCYLRETRFCNGEPREKPGDLWKRFSDYDEYDDECVKILILLTTKVSCRNIFKDVSRDQDSFAIAVI